MLLGNRDDHLRNDGVLRGPRGWVLAPAFDVNPNPDEEDHAIALDAPSGAPDLGIVHATRELYRLTESDALRIEREVRDAFDGWRHQARSAGVSRREVQLLESVIDPSR